MRSEFTLQAKTVEEAYAKANDIYSSLGEISIEVINPGKKGFLGLGRVLAEIKVIVDDGKEEIKEKNKDQAKPKTEKKQPKKEAQEKKNAPQQKAENKPKQQKQ